MTRATRLLAVMLPLLFTGAAAAQVADLAAREEAALHDAVERVAPSIVKIEAIGGLERVGDVLLGDGPSTGLIVAEDGYIVSSAFNFSQEPTSILVTLNDGVRTPAKLVATDKSRMLVLLKVNSASPLPVPEAAPVAELRPGQWAVAVGRTFDTSLPQYSIGIISALDRIWGKAIQTDAKVSPNNYGGPLVDIQGRVIGVLAPLSPDAPGEAAGVEWYDSGIGFAVPLEDVYRVLPRWREGRDLVPGIMGVSLKTKDLYGEQPVIAVCRSDSPAYKAGLRVGDKIVAIDGRRVHSQSQMKHAVSPRYAGEKVRIKVERGDAEFEREVELIEKLEPYRHAFLGILPSREADAAGVVVRFVYPDSPAAKAGMQPGDTIATVDGAAIENVDALRERLNGLAPGQAVRVDFRRGQESLYPSVTLGSLPETVPDALPSGWTAQEPSAGERPTVGQFTLELPDYPNRSLAYVPADYDPARSYGLLVYLHPAGGEEDAKVLERWSKLCDREGLILLAPKSLDPKRWRTEEFAYLRRAVDQMTSRYTIDPQRIVACGREAGASAAYLLGFQHRDLFRGVAALDGAFSARPLENDPAERLSFFIAFAKASPHAPTSGKAIELLRGLNYPVTLKDLGEKPRDLDEAEISELGRWIDSLDKL